MKKSAKFISLFLCIAIVFSVAGAMVISSFAAETPTISVTQVSNNGKLLVLKVSVSKGYVNALDLKFSMSGLECKKVADMSGRGSGTPTPPGSASHYSCAATEPIKGDLAQVTLEIKNANKYSFSVNATECAVTEDIVMNEWGTVESIGDTVRVTPIIIGNISYEADHTSSSTSTTTTTTTKGTSIHNHIIQHISHPASCISHGIEYDYCAACERKFNFEITPATGHTEGESIIVKEPTDNSCGIKIIFCSVCGAKLKTEEIDATPSRVHSVSINDISLIYKDESVLYPIIEKDTDAKYSIEYSSSNSDIVTVDENGILFAINAGNAEITCTITDSEGNTVSDTCTVNVKISWWQWLIKIILLGFIWY